MLGRLGQRLARTRRAPPPCFPQSIRRGGPPEECTALRVCGGGALPAKSAVSAGSPAARVRAGGLCFAESEVGPPGVNLMRPLRRVVDCIRSGRGKAPASFSADDFSRVSLTKPLSCARSGSSSCSHHCVTAGRCVQRGTRPAERPSGAAGSAGPAEWAGALAGAARKQPGARRQPAPAPRPAGTRSPRGEARPRVWPANTPAASSSFPSAPGRPRPHRRAQWPSNSPAGRAWRVRPVQLGPCTLLPE